jgi:diguanylate cyclase (GGDEF)-like protein
VTTPDAGPAADPRVAPVLRVLIVEDDEDDATLLVAQLASAGRSISHRRVDTAARMREALIAAEWDIVISDHVMPGFSSSAALQVLRQSGRNIPFIIYSGCISDQVLAEVRRDCVHDCIAKGKIGELVPALEHALGAGAEPLHDALNLVRLADYDRVTGLPLRDLFMRQATQRLASAADEHVAVCCVDLTRFRRINQTFGYEAADRVLAQIARRLRTGISDGLVSRMGGDRFVLVCGGLHSMEELQLFAERTIDRLAESCVHGGLQLHLASSMGVSVWPQDGNTLEELMLHAETAMFRCKRLLGRNGFIFYFKGMDEDVGRSLVIESAL